MSTRHRFSRVRSTRSSKSNWKQTGYVPTPMFVAHHKFKAGQFGIAFSETFSSCRCTRHGLHHVWFSAFLPPWEHGPGNIHASREIRHALGLRRVAKLQTLSSTALSRLTVALRILEFRGDFSWRGWALDLWFVLQNWRTFLAKTSFWIPNLSLEVFSLRNVAPCTANVYISVLLWFLTLKNMFQQWSFSR